MSTPLALEEDRVRWFRARRSGLADAPHEDAVAAARAVIGAQAQQPFPAFHGLSLRSRDRPTSSRVQSMLLEDRVLIRTWGQRDTLHLYTPEDWPLVVAARNLWPRSGRKGAMPGDEELGIARRAFTEADGPLFRRDLFDLIPQRFVDEAGEHPGVTGSAVRFAATRLIWCLAMEGLLCFAHRDGSEQAYCHRRHWLPDLDWPEEPDPSATARRLARRYLAVHGPATAHDLAHFFGANVTTARLWLRELEGETVAATCGPRTGLVLLADDADAVRTLAPDPGDGPVTLLPQWDAHLMRHRDKTWLLPDLSEAPHVWAAGGVVRPTVLLGGRIVATWSHRTTSRALKVEITPLSGWKQELLEDVHRRGEELATHLGVDDVEIAAGA